MATRKTKPPRDLDAKRLTAMHSAPDVVWIRSDWFCPSCGAKNVWQLSDDGEDYYHECSVTCHTCEHMMCCVGKLTIESEN